MTKKWVLGLVAGVCVLGSAAVSAQQALPDLKVAVDLSYEPFTYKLPTGQPAGFDVDIANALCAQIKRKCVFVEQVWDGMIPGLQAKKYDVIISSMAKNEDRARVVDFTNKYYHTGARIVMPKGFKYTSPESLKGKKIGVLKASIQEKWALTYLKPAGADVVSYPGRDPVYLDINSGRLDGSVADSVEIAYGFLKKPEGQNFEFVSDTLVDKKIFGEGASIAMRKGQPELKKSLNDAIAAIRADGRYKQIADKYFDFDPYGKD